MPASFVIRIGLLDENWKLRSSHDHPIWRLKWQLLARTLPVEVPEKADTLRHAPLCSSRLCACCTVPAPEASFCGGSLAGLLVGRAVGQLSHPR